MLSRRKRPVQCGAHLAAAIRLGTVGRSLFPGKVIPTRLVVYFLVPKRVDDRSKRRGHDNTLHGRGISFDRLEDPGGALDRRVQEILHRILHIVMEWRSSVEDIFKGWGGFDRLCRAVSKARYGQDRQPVGRSGIKQSDLVECTLLGNVLNNDIGELLFRGIRMGV
jgi:hypothetical protein